MSKDANLTGTWIGGYQQHGQACPITAELVQDGEILTGSMQDGQPDQELSLSELAPGEDEQIVARLRAMFPDAPGDPIRYVSHLPGESTLQGWVRGTHVYLLKSYQGTHFGGFKVGDQVVGQSIERHTVEYRGRLEAGGEEIEGQWSIEPVPELGGERAEGSFTLQRRPDRAGS